MKELFNKEFLSKEYLLNNKEKVAKIAIITIIVLVALFIFLFRTGNQEEIPLVEDGTKMAVKEKEGEEPAPVIADVGGAVVSPMVVELEEGSRIGDAIDAAGGLTEDADITGINRAAVVNDGDKIYIPKKGEEGIAGIDSQGCGSSDGKVNINTATTAELQTVNGIGPATAEKILLYRASNGSFRSLEDLKKVDGIGDKTYEKLKDQLTI